jgi:hypothetical protein
MMQNNTRSQYDIMPTNYNNQIYPINHSIYQPPQNQQITSIALFHIPSDATNSLYVDGVPNDTSKREVSRNYRFYQTSFDHFPDSSAFDLFKK